MPDEMRCSECNRPFVDAPCGLIHLIAQRQIALARELTRAMFRMGKSR